MRGIANQQCAVPARKGDGRALAQAAVSPRLNARLARRLIRGDSILSRGADSLKL